MDYDSIVLKLTQSTILGIINWDIKREANDDIRLYLPDGELVSEFRCDNRIDTSRIIQYSSVQLKIPIYDVDLDLWTHRYVYYLVIRENYNLLVVIGEYDLDEPAKVYDLFEKVRGSVVSRTLGGIQ